MMKNQRVDLTKVRTISIAGRASKVRPGDFARPFDPRGDSFRTFVRNLPKFLAANDLRAIVDDIVSARRRKAPVILMMGAHVIKVGLAPLLIDLVRRRVITAVAMNSAAANMLDGSFGMARETGEFINAALLSAYWESDEGYGEALGRGLLAAKARHRSSSLLATCVRAEIPITVHAAIGTDITHQQPTMDGAATGETSFRDFRSLCATCMNLRRGGVVLNVGSAVIMPEVFLKALTVARNLGAKARGFTTVVMDMNRHYRPTVNVQQRPTQGHGRGYYLTGHHELMVPLLAAMIRSRVR
jgi:deoxyhypusine synthase